jgi:hypothetical protein
MALGTRMGRSREGVTVLFSDVLINISDVNIE